MTEKDILELEGFTSNTIKNYEDGGKEADENES